MVEDFGRGATIHSVPGTGLAEMVEDGLAGTERARQAVRGALGAQIAAGADTVVLGCTHYHFLADDIRTEFPQVSIIDTSEAVARRAVQLLDELGLRAEGDDGELDLIVSGDHGAFRDAMGRLGFHSTTKEAVT